eukprot:symbB.v1.2.005400.t1/scaffold316.1/size230253/15
MALKFKKNAVAEGRFELSRFEPRLKEVLEQLAEDRLSLEDFDDLTDGKSSSNISIFHLEDFGVCQSTANEFGLREAGYAELGAPAIQAKDDWSFASVSHRIIVFVLGGFTHSELRVAKEVQEKLPRGTEVLVGGTSLLTPKRLIRALRPKTDTAEGKNRRVGE